MDSEPELEVIREQMHHTRSSLSDKLEALESQVLDTVQTATETVANTVGEVKDVVESVSETVQSVTEQFSISHQVEQRPWTMVACSVGLGFAGGMFLGSSRQVPEAAPAPSAAPTFHSGSSAVATGAPAPGAPAYDEKHEEKKEEGGLSWAWLGKLAGPWVERLSQAWSDIARQAQEMAVGALMGTVRHAAVGALPDSVHSQVTSFVDDVTRKLGGKPQPPEPPKPAHHDDGQGHEDDHGRSAHAERHEETAFGAPVPAASHEAQAARSQSRSRPRVGQPG